MPDKVFLLTDDGDLEPMGEARYERELDLQAYIATHWDLLPGEQMNPAEPRRWLLVKKEKPRFEHGGPSPSSRDSKNC